MWFFTRNKRRASKVNKPRPRSRPQLEALEDRCTPAAGALDLTFGGDGIVTTNIGTGAHDLAIMPDGRLVAAGAATSITGWPLDTSDRAVARFLPTGALDTTFGGDGIVTTDFKRNGDYTNAVVVQADGKIIVGGSTDLDTRIDLVHNLAFALTRYNVDGSLDTTFGGPKAKGKIVMDLSPQNDVIVDLVLQADGKILAVGGSSYSNIVLARFLNNGTLDNSFGTNGLRILDLGGFESAQNVVIQPDGKIVIAGITDSTGSRDFVLARFTATGALDPTFGTAGIVTTDIVSGGISAADIAYCLALQADGKLVVAGLTDELTYRQLVLARYNANGALDTTFGADRNADGIRDGLVLTGMGDSHSPSLVIDANGRIIATTTGGSDFSVARFLSDGSFDSTFGTNGIITTDPTPPIDGYSAPDGAGAVALDSAGRIVVAGSAGGALALIRYQGDAPLQAFGGPASGSNLVATLTNEQMQPLLAEAIARWSAAGADTSKLANLTVQIVDLDSGLLGLASGNTIYLDANAAGWGWFVDATPGNDSEFTTPGDQGEQNRMDLLTVLEHELGHLLGYDHQETGVMDDTLATGTRATPWAGTGSDWSAMDSFFATQETNSLGFNKRNR